MRVIKNEKKLTIFKNGIETFDSIPAGGYLLQFSDLEGFFLTETEIVPVTYKVYGNNSANVQKILGTFEVYDRNLGVILSGDKGTGKTIFTRMLSVAAIDRNIPVIIVREAYPGIVKYIENIDQEVMIVFDEFEKTFGNGNDDDENSEQSRMLTLFDGITFGKKLFIVVCNNARKLNRHMINRPGRFHYHIRFNNPSKKEMIEYLNDNVKKEFHGEIEDVVAFSSQNSLNYDCLRAIALELNCGNTFKSAISYLNIVDTNVPNSYVVRLIYDNNVVGTCSNAMIDFYENKNEDYHTYWMENDVKDCFATIGFRTSDIVYDRVRGINIVPPEKINIDYEDYDEILGLVDQCKNSKVKRVEVIKTDTCLDYSSCFR